MAAPLVSLTQNIHTKNRGRLTTASLHLPMLTHEKIGYVEFSASGDLLAKPLFSFPRGRRFQLIESSGNEFAVWSDKE